MPKNKKKNKNLLVMEQHNEPIHNTRRSAGKRKPPPDIPELHDKGKSSSVQTQHLDNPKNDELQQNQRNIGVTVVQIHQEPKQNKLLLTEAATKKLNARTLEIQQLLKHNTGSVNSEALNVSAPQFDQSQIHNPLAVPVVQQRPIVDGCNVEGHQVPNNEGNLISENDQPALNSTPKTLNVAIPTQVLKPNEKFDQILSQPKPIPQNQNLEDQALQNADQENGNTFVQEKLQFAQNVQMRSHVQHHNQQYSEYPLHTQLFQNNNQQQPNLSGHILQAHQQQPYALRPQQKETVTSTTPLQLYGTQHVTLMEENKILRNIIQQFSPLQQITVPPPPPPVLLPKTLKNVAENSTSDRQGCPFSNYSIKKSSGGRNQYQVERKNIRQKEKNRRAREAKKNISEPELSMVSAPSLAPTSAPPQPQYPYQYAPHPGPPHYPTQYAPPPGFLHAPLQCATQYAPPSGLSQPPPQYPFQYPIQAPPLYMTGTYPQQLWQQFPGYYR